MVPSGRARDGVVAQEVKALAEQSSAATATIAASLEEVDSEANALIGQSKHGRKLAGAVSESARSIEAAVENFERANLELTGGAQAITSAAGNIGKNCVQLGSGMDTLGAEVTHLSDDMSAAMERVEGLLSWSERLTAATAPMAPDEVDARLINVVVDLAMKIGHRFEQAVATAEIDMNSLFDEKYQPIAGTNPQQFTSRHASFTDRALPDFIEPFLQIDPKIVSCAATDQNGYIATHNRKWSEKQTGDPVHDTTLSRNRRMFDDRVGLASARSKARFRLQTYRRDTGNNQFAIMKNLSAPIFLNGRHWGAIRIIYRI